MRTGSSARCPSATSAETTNSDLRLTLFHEDMSESYIVWEWEKGAGYLYRPSDSYFRESRVVDEPPADDILTEQT